MALLLAYNTANLTCESFFWIDAAAAISPDGSNAAKIQHLPIPPDGTIRAEIRCGWRYERLTKRGDAAIARTEITWSDDSSQVMVWGENLYGTDLHLVYDCGLGRQVDFKISRLPANELVLPQRH